MKMTGLRYVHNSYFVIYKTAYCNICSLLLYDIDAHVLPQIIKRTTGKLRNYRIKGDEEKDRIQI